MIISKKKQAEFDDIFKSISEGNFFINIDLFRNLFESDFYEIFLTYVDDKMKNEILKTDIIILHSNINSVSIKDTYYYDKIIQFSILLHNYTHNIKKIIVYGSSPLLMTILKTINIALGTNIIDKIIFNEEKNLLNIKKSITM